MDLTPALLLLLSMFLLLRQQAGALSIVNMTVPSYVTRGENARLICRYDLGSDKLHSVTWYKDNENIYRFTRKNNKQQDFSISGVQVNTHKSNYEALELQSVGFNATGLYMCEVSSDSLPFKNVKGHAYMEVIEPAKSDPEIKGGEEIYATGDILALNCTSSASYPAAQLQWFINDVPVDPDSEMAYQTSNGLHIMKSSLRLELNPFHLSQARIQIKCASTVRTSSRSKSAYVNTRTKTIYVQGHGSLSMPSLSLLLVALLLLLLLRRD